MTSIAEQLKAAGLARQPHGLGGGQQGGSKVSLLYTPQEADSMDMDTVCALGSNGLSKLIGISSTFESFRALFVSRRSRCHPRPPVHPPTSGAADSFSSRAACPPPAATHRRRVLRLVTTIAS